MKNIFEIMKEYGLEVPADKQKDFEKAVLENYKTVTDYNNQTEKLAVANEKIKASDAATEKLKKKLEDFGDADVSALKQQITDLEKEKKKIETDYQGKLADRDFSDSLREGITAAKGRNVKAITALLDVDTLKKSKNQKEDITAALKELSEAEDSKELFGEAEPQVQKQGNIIGAVFGGGVDAADARMRAVMDFRQHRTQNRNKEERQCRTQLL